MKILLLGEYSNMHNTLAQGLRALGCDVTVASDGDGFKNYPRDIDINRHGYGVLHTIKYISLLLKKFRQFKGFDVVQIVNPFFLDLKAKRNLQFFRFLQKHNSKVFLGAFGNDYFWVKACMEKKVFRYSEFDIPNRENTLPEVESLISAWIGSDKETLNRKIAKQSNGIIACLYEYNEAYKTDFGDKLVYIPEPINLSAITYRQRGLDKDKLRFFIGIQKKRNRFKGTDLMYKALQTVCEKYPNETSMEVAKSVPYDQYIKMMANADVLLDQLYSYSPGMNALDAMAQGLVVVGGGEPEMYELMGEYRNRPIINVYPNEQDIVDKLEYLVLNRAEVATLSEQSRLFIEQHHDYIKVAQLYLDFWNRSN